MTHLSTIQRVGFACVIALTAWTAPVAWSQTIHPDPDGLITAQPEDLVPPDGSRSVRILGDPSQPGNYVMRITFAPGTGTRPHFHDQARYITVLEGTWWVARGPDAATYNPELMTRIKAGSFLYQPANGVHYDQARDEAVTVQISGIGPMKSTRLESDQ